MVIQFLSLIAKSVSAKIDGRYIKTDILSIIYYAKVIIGLFIK